MNFLGKIVALAAALALLEACGSGENPQAVRAEKIATAYCECTAQLAALNKEVATLAADTVAGGRDLRPYFLQMQTEYQRAKDCSAAIIGQFGKLTEEDFPGVEKALQTKCPDLTEQRDLLREMLQ